jgi:putative membrane protein
MRTETTHPPDAMQPRRRSRLRLHKPAVEHRLRRVGDDPDPRFTFANERTFLAWNRTALALVGGGLAVAQLLDFDIHAVRLVIALPLLALGAVTALSSYRRWERNERALRLSQPLPYSRLPELLGVGIGVVSLLAAAVVIADLLFG